MHPRRDLVDQHLRSAVFGNHKQFDCEHADIVQRIGDLLGDAALATRLAGWRKQQTDAVKERPEGSA